MKAFGEGDKAARYRCETSGAREPHATPMVGHGLPVFRRNALQDMLPTLLGTAAGTLSTASFVPQVLKAWREGNTEAISKRMYLVSVSAFVLWTAYGFLLGSVPLIVFNALSLILSGSILVLKLRQSKRSDSGTANARFVRSG
jgi:MtN3 and saliva related transmembrane protein